MKTAALVLLVALLGALAVAVAFIIVDKKKTPSPGPPGPPPPCPQRPLGRLAEPMEFYLLSSTDGVTGRTVDGDLSSSGKVTEEGFKTKEDLGTHLLTYAHGHPYYSSSNDRSGALRGGSWASHASSSAPSLRACGPQTSADKVLVIEDGQQMCLDCDAAFVGLVVRRGGLVLIGGGTITLKVQFLMIESGGLFQAGSSYDSNYRYEGKFTILLVSSDAGYAQMGCPASQYSYKVYAPGVEVPTDGSQCTFLPYTGMSSIWNNGYGPKSVCVGFNGNYHLAGSLGPSARYEGTWNAWDSAEGGNPVFSDDDRLSSGVDWLPETYAATWLPLAVGSYPAGNTSIKVRIPDGAPGNFLDWWAGKKVVVLACPERLATCDAKTGATGMLPLWVGNADPAQAQANADANKNFLSQRPSPIPSIGTEGTTPGVEVATVSSVTADGTITFSEPLRFDHTAARTHLHRSFGTAAGAKDIYVDTVPHVCLLSRSIVITSELGEGGSGCNVPFEKSSPSTSMAMGRSGRHITEIASSSGMAEMAAAAERDKTTTPAITQEGTMKGPGGSVVCNNEGSGGHLNEVFTTCYKNLPNDPGKFCGDEKPGAGEDLEGHWLWGTAGKKGCAAIHGGQHMFRYGSAVCLDSAELFRLGTPGNFGHIAQYAIHAHLCGYAKAFTDYLPSKSHPRELRVANSSIWLSMSRWITLHGTAEAEVSNNVGFFTFGSGYFVEDGPEFMNVFDHNMGAYAVPAVVNDYLNTPPIYPNVATDYGTMSVFWLKCNANVVARNVACCSPGSTIGYWLVPQVISWLRGPSTLAIGSEPLGLPGFGSKDNAVLCKNSRGGLNQAGACNADGSLPSVAGSGKRTACWVPDDFKFPLIEPNTLCPANTSDNTRVPWMGFMENVAYCCFMLLGEMPEMIEASSLAYDMSVGSSIGIGAQIQDLKSRPQWMPFNGQTRCTDEAVGVYAETIWDKDLPYQPLTDEQVADADQYTQSQDEKSRSIPKIMSGVLAFCLGPYQNLWGGVAWAKQMASWMINCAYLDPSASGGKVGIGAGANPPNCYSSSDTTVFLQGVQAPGVTYNKMYPVFVNFLCNGLVAMPPSPSLWLGQHTFLADSCSFFPGQDESIFDNKTSVQKYFCDFGPLAIEDVFPNPLRIDPGAAKRDLYVYIYDVKNSKLGTVDFSSGKWTTKSQAFPSGGNQVKFPFVCDNDKLRRALGGRQPDFNSSFGLGEASANLVTKHFFTPGALSIGDQICAGIYRIPPDLPAQGWPGSGAHVERSPLSDRRGRRSPSSQPP